MDFKGRPFTTTGTEPGWFEVTVARWVQAHIEAREPRRVQVLGELGGLFIDDLHGVMRFGRHAPHLRWMRWAGGPWHGQARGFEGAPLQSGPANSLVWVGEQVATLGFMLVVGEFGAAGEGGGVSRIGLAGREEGLPVVIELAQDPLGHLARQGAVVGGALHQFRQLGIRNVAVFEDAGLAHQIVGGGVEILGQESRVVHGGKA